MGFGVLKALVLCVFVDAAFSADVFQNPGTQGFCEAPPTGGLDYILRLRKPDYGWGENTHRANIALAVNRWEGTSEETAKMGLQLEDEIITALMSSSPMHETDLALFIHALIATQRNPRNFHGIDLVADLLRRVDSDPDVHPFLVMALCNSHAVEFSHLQKIKKYTVHTDNNHTLDAWEVGMKALSLKALACAATLPGARSRNLDKFQHSMEEAAKCLTSRQVNGIFWNPYATSLAVQALTAYGKEEWEEQKALDYLKRESEIYENIVKAYYMEVALNARDVKFIKDLYNGSYDPPNVSTVEEYFTTYTIKDDQEPNIYFSVIMKIPRGWNFFHVMERASALSNSFRFSHYMNKNEEPIVYKVIGKPNDAEENMFWRICRQTNINHDPHTSNVTTFPYSPAMFTPEVAGEHVILWYRSTPCPSG